MEGEEGPVRPGLAAVEGRGGGGHLVMVGGEEEEAAGLLYGGGWLQELVLALPGDLLVEGQAARRAVVVQEETLLRLETRKNIVRNSKSCKALLF